MGKVKLPNNKFFEWGLFVGGILFGLWGLLSPVTIYFFGDDLFTWSLKDWELYTLLLGCVVYSIVSYVFLFRKFR